MTIADFNIKPSAKMLREFGIIALFGFGLVGSLLGLKWEAWTASYMLWALGAVSFVLALVQPRLLLPLYVVLMVVAFPIGFVISNVILLALYFGLFTPFSMVFRLIGRDTMKRKFEPEAESYWIKRTGSTPASQRFKQY
ncbi:MAG: SxtJ family membrane protein [Roseibacillus sp.]|nr:SxtJ family membrane protein [Roseibacillus sp.]